MTVKKRTHRQGHAPPNLRWRHQSTLSGMWSIWRTLRQYRRDDLDDWAALDEPTQDEPLRVMVDSLPAVQKHIVERVYFGGATITEAAKEAGINVKQARTEEASALKALRALLREADEVGSLSAAFLAREP